MTAILFHTVNIVVLLTILFVFARKKIKAHFDQQHAEFTAKLRDAGAQYEKAKAEFEALKSDVENLEDRLAEMRRMSMREIEFESARIEAEADRQIQAAIQEGELRLNVEGERLKASLESELLDGAMQMARKTLEREMKSSEGEWISQMATSESGLSAGKKNYAS